MHNLGVVVRGIRLPMIKKDDKVAEIVFQNLKDTAKEEGITFQDKDVISITESIVARSFGNYVSVDDIANDIINKFGKDATIGVLWPIYSRNRFSLILKGIARGAKKVIIQLNLGKDEVGNDLVNPFTNVDIKQFYKEIVNGEGAEVAIYESNNIFDITRRTGNIIVSTIHHRENDAKYFKYRNIANSMRDVYGMEEVSAVYTLADICATKNDKHGYNEEYGLLGSNKATEDMLKLFPRREQCKEVCDYVKEKIQKEFGVTVEVCVYGDGCFKDPVGGIWEFADPITCPYYTKGLEGTPNEIKIKYLIDNEFSNESGEDLNEKVREVVKNKENNLVGKMISQGTTPRRYIDLIASLSDLCSGSGDRATPVVLIQNYFQNYGNS